MIVRNSNRGSVRSAVVASLLLCTWVEAPAVPPVRGAADSAGHAAAKAAGAVRRAPAAPRNLPPPPTNIPTGPMAAPPKALPPPPPPLVNTPAPLKPTAPAQPLGGNQQYGPLPAAGGPGQLNYGRLGKEPVYDTVPPQSPGVVYSPLPNGGGAGARPAVKYEQLPSTATGAGGNFSTQDVSKMLPPVPGRTPGPATPGYQRIPDSAFKAPGGGAAKAVPNPPGYSSLPADAGRQAPAVLPYSQGRAVIGGGQPGAPAPAQRVEAALPSKSPSEAASKGSRTGIKALKGLGGAAVVTGLAVGGGAVAREVDPDARKTIDGALDSAGKAVNSAVDSVSGSKD
ncbi:MAG: hypothetical protein R3E48_01340 [Burkholderiaceae bacterium]